MSSITSSITYRSVVLLLLVLTLLSPLLAKTDYAKYNTRIGKKFLEENAVKEGVVTLPSGLQYKVLTAGSGTEHPTASSQVKVHYRGTLLSGVEFDSSHKRGEPSTFGVGQVIKGWTEALQLMVEGDEWEVYIPSDLAYGERGTGSNIGPNSALIFKVQLIEILGTNAAPEKKAKKSPFKMHPTESKDL
jgi:FKBP-type peptidyl-prolyl cis-trans isomerase